LDPVGIISSNAQRPAAAGEVQQAVTVAALKEGKLALDIRRQTDYDAGTVVNSGNYEELHNAPYDTSDDPAQ
jgi:hypothetical protein